VIDQKHNVVAAYGSAEGAWRNDLAPHPAYIGLFIYDSSVANDGDAIIVCTNLSRKKRTSRFDLCITL
jgi:hypothetical protein